MTLVPGRPGPDFTLQSQHGERFSLSSLRGSRVVVMFYPFAFSRICTDELAAIRDGLPELHDGGVVALAVSCDPIFTLRAFADAQRLTFPLLSDFWPHGHVAREYGVFDEEQGCARRGTFLLDPAGAVRWQVVNDLGQARDLEDVRRALADPWGRP